MKIKRRRIIFLFPISFLFIAASWPLGEKRGITSTFGEWRDGHLHAGIDLPTMGIGEEVYSVSNGWIMRVRTSSWGYGKSIYIKDSLGNINVYAHLSSFSKKVEKIIRREQLKRLSYMVNLWLGKGEIPVKEGEVIGYTGRSGCLYPHLHFEMRNPESRVVDPLVRGFSFPDTFSPDIRAIRFVPLDDSSTVFGSHLGVEVPVIKETLFVNVKGRVGIEIETYDKVNGHSGLLGPKEIDLYRDRELIRREYIDSFLYSDFKDSRFLFDYSYGVRTGRRFRRLFTVPGNDFPFYEGREGILTSSDTGVVSIIVGDAALNKAVLNISLVDSVDKTIDFGRADFNNRGIITTPFGFLVNIKDSRRWIGSNSLGKISKSGDSMLVFNLGKKVFSSFQSSDSRCTIYPTDNTILNTSIISVRVRKGKLTKWFWEPFIPLNNQVEMEITTPEESPFYSIYEQKEKKWEYYPTEKRGEKLVTSIDHLGIFALLKDTVSPIISLKRSYFSEKEPLQIYVQDSISGIDFYWIITLIDHKPTVFRYDPQKNRLIYEYPEEIIKGRHTLYVYLRDRQGNEASGEWEILKKE